MPLTTAAAPASAHTAYKTVTKYKQQCEMRDYWQRMPTVPASYELRQREHCIQVPYPAQASRRHIHTSGRVCTYIVLAGGAAGGALGASGGPGTGAAGAVLGGAAGYEVCRMLPRIIWLG